MYYSISQRSTFVYYQIVRIEVSSAGSTPAFYADKQTKYFCCNASLLLHVVLESIFWGKIFGHES